MPGTARSGRRVAVVALRVDAPLDDLVSSLVDLEQGTAARAEHQLLFAVAVRELARRTAEIRAAVPERGRIIDALADLVLHGVGESLRRVVSDAAEQQQGSRGSGRGTSEGLHGGSPSPMYSGKRRGCRAGSPSA